MPHAGGGPLLRLHHRLLAALNAVGTAWVAAMAALICADVLGRALFRLPIIGVPEIVKVSVVGIVWLQMAHTLRINGHLRSDVILGRVPARVRACLNLAAYVLGACVFTLLVLSGWSSMIVAWEMGEFEGEEPVRVPTYPLRSIVLLGAALTALQFALMAIEVLRGLLAPAAEEG